MTGLAEMIGAETGLEPTGKFTSDGRPVFRNPAGGFSTELTTTVRDPRINKGRWTNIPLLHFGKVMDEDSAIRIISENGGFDPETGRELKGFKSLGEAEQDAKTRSQALSKELIELGLTE